MQATLLSGASFADAIEFDALDVFVVVGNRTEIGGDRHSRDVDTAVRVVAGHFHKRRPAWTTRQVEQNDLGEVGDSRHTANIDQIAVVGGLMVVGVSSGECEENGDVLQVKRLLIAWPESVGNLLDREPFRLAKRIDQRVEPWACASAVNGQLVLLVEPADHVEVDHDDGVLEREERVIDVMLRAEQAFFLAGEGRENDSARQGVASPGEPSGHFHHHGSSRRVIIRAVVDIGRRFIERAGHPPAMPEVVIMRANDDRFIRERAFAFENADHITRIDRLAADLVFRRDRPILEFHGSGL